MLCAWRPENENIMQLYANHSNTQGKYLVISESLDHWSYCPPLLLQLAPRPLWRERWKNIKESRMRWVCFLYCHSGSLVVWLLAVPNVAQSLSVKMCCPTHSNMLCTGLTFLRNSHLHSFILFSNLLLLTAAHPSCLHTLWRLDKDTIRDVPQPAENINIVSSCESCVIYICLSNVPTWMLRGGQVCVDGFDTVRTKFRHASWPQPEMEELRVACWNRSCCF